MALALVMVGLAACGGGGNAADPREEQRAAEFAALEQGQEALRAKISRVEELQQQLAAGGEAGGEASEPVDRDALAAEAEQLGAEVYEEAFDQGGRIAEFINAAGAELGEALPERLQKAIRMKSETDILLAQEHIEKGGDYAKAIGIYEAALLLDPESEPLKQAMAAAESLRWMSEERFAAVKKGMSEAEVKAALGPPNAHNVRDYPERKARAWFYPKGPDRSAAAVFFQQKGEGPFTVYKADFNAVKTGGEDEESG